MSGLFKNGINYTGAIPTAEEVSYDNTSSGISATNTQDAIDDIIKNTYTKDETDEVIRQKTWDMATQTQLVAIENEVAEQLGVVNSNLISLEYEGWTIPDGMPIKDSKLVGRVDMGDLTWYKQSTSSSNWRFYANLSSLNIKDGSTNAYMDAYDLSTSTWSGVKGYQMSGVQVTVCDLAISSEATFKESVKGKYLYFELATAKTYTDGKQAIDSLKSDLAYKFAHISGTLIFKQIGNLVVVNGYCTNLSIGTDATLVGTIPSNISTPSETIRCICNVGDNPWSVGKQGYLSIGTDRQINVQCGSGTGSAFYLSCSYIVSK